jgi:serine/threonine protein kinase
MTMRATEQLGRYRLLDLVSQDDGIPGRPEVSLWHGYDEILDRPVAVRVLSADDPRAPAVLGAAQAAARVDDRRLLRVLDILNLGSTSTDPARIAVVSEWASGRNLERTLQDRVGTPFAAPEALSLVAEVARAIAAGSAESVSHGRLRPSSVFITDAGEVRIRGLAVDAAVFGPMPDTATPGPRDPVQADVDALGCLVYLLTTGYWPGSAPIDAPDAPRAGDVVLPPSQVRAAVPRGVDDVIARSVITAARPRGVARVPDAGAFATMVGAALDHLAPLTTTIRPVPRTPARRRVHTGLVVLGRVVAVAFGVALVAGIAWAGWALISAGPQESTTTASGTLDEMLTAPARPVDDLAGSSVERTFPIVRYRSYDPFGDDDGNGKPDKRKGRESEELVGTVNDVDPETAWLTSEYTTADLDGKEGVGLVLDLGQPQDIQQLSMNLVGRGSAIDLRVADRVLADPALWTPLASAFAPKDQIVMRAPRPITGRYVLIWFTQVPPAVDQGAGVYQGGVRSVVVSG